MAGTNVPPVIFTAVGFRAPPDSAILIGTQQDINGAFGGNLDFSTSADAPTNPTPQGQLAASEAAIISAADAIFVYYTTQTDPAYAQGRMQDAIGRIYFIERNPAQPTVLQVACNGLNGVVIPQSAQVIDTAGNIYACTTGGTIPTGGTITLPFANLLPGPIAIPETLTIYQAVPGWDTAGVVSGSLGNDVESRAAFETRRAATVLGNSFGAIGSIIGAVAQISGVLDYWGYDNATDSPATVFGVTIPANSIYIVVVGGTEATVAQAIWSKKAPGCSYYGNTTVTVYDNNPLFASPPAYQVQYETPRGLQILFDVDLVSNALVPADAATLIQSAIINAFSGGDGGPRARIAGLILATRFIAPIALLGPWAQVRSIQIGSLNTPGAIFVGSIAGTTLTVNSTTSGTVAIGQTIDDDNGGILAGTVILSGAGSSWVVNNLQTVSGAAFTGTAGSPSTHLIASAVTGTISIGDLPLGTGIADGTTILSQLSGTPGGSGTYILNMANTTSAAALTTGRTIYGSMADQNSVQVQADQEPEIEATNILVTVD